ncbi:cytochrome P450 [Ketobacter sp. MCCC 1A13808]|uniref:cytochrome P450 n=1 Tax=Ketobacter sp. MCCC 1A13808 TaxID=2602738 RepID=UPI0012EB3511|nr:cytochrome P450 [Ketobacter sp. MCCC 1A13808]MVF10806.1 cytochrome P450 [Ketobacter sp. MCCC 1A13808]
MSKVDGVWSISVKGPTGEQKTELVLQTVDGKLTGTQSGKGAPQPISNAAVEGDKISWINHVTSPIKMKVEFKATLSGEQMSGKIKAGLMGSYRFSGYRISRDVADASAIDESEENSTEDPFIAMLAKTDPIPDLHYLRSTDPVHFVAPFGFWVITRHDDIQRLFNDPENVTHIKREWNLYTPHPEGSMRKWSDENAIHALAPAEHSRLRRLTTAAFTPRAVARMDQQIKEVVKQLIDPLRGREGETIDIMGEFTNKVPNVVISRITGITPGADEVRFCEIAQAVVQGGLPFISDEVRQESERGFVEFAAWIRDLVKQRRRNPQEDLVSDLIRAQDADQNLSEDDIVLLLASLIGAGSEATAMVATLAIKALLENPIVMARLRDDRAQIRKSIDEIIRYAFSIPPGTMRFAVRDFDLRGKKISKGQMLMLSAGGANRDPEKYEKPDDLNLDRVVQTRQLTFGHGPNFCVGVNLAKEEIASMINALLDVIPAGSRICESRIEYRDMGIMKQAISLPVFIGPPA